MTPAEYEAAKKLDQIVATYAADSGDERRLRAALVELVDAAKVAARVAERERIARLATRHGAPELAARIRVLPD